MRTGFRFNSCNNSKLNEENKMENYHPESLGPFGGMFFDPRQAEPPAQEPSFMPTPASASLIPFEAAPVTGSQEGGPFSAPAWTTVVDLERSFLSGDTAGSRLPGMVT